MAITGIEDRRYWNWIATEFLEWKPILYDEAKRDSFLKVSSSKRRQSKPSLQQEETKQTEFTIESGTNTIEGNLPVLKSQEPQPSESLSESKFHLRRRSARLKSQESEPSESLHESIEATRKRRSIKGSTG